MTAVVVPSYEDRVEVAIARSGFGWLRRIRTWVATRWMEFAVAGPLLVLVGVVQAIGVDGWPSIINDDEGTYMAQAWAVLTGNGPHHGLAQYTYWYDHPPLGWIQLAYIGALTHAFRAGTMAVVSGRHIMVGYALVSTALVYVLARRIGCSRVWSGGAMALFGLSPLSIDFLRLVFLDCIGLPWALAAYVLLHSRSKRVWAYAASGACFAVCVLSKETYLLMLPAVALEAWISADRAIRRMAMTLFGTVFLVVASFYPLYAALKGELIPGKGHVSLLGSALWQVDQRAGSGSVFSASSASHDQVMSWLHSDPWLVGLGLLAVPLALVNRRLWGVAGAVLIFAMALLRHGYLPEAFVVGALPFAALTIAGAGDEATRRLRRLYRVVRTSPRRRFGPGVVLLLGGAMFITLVGGLAWHIGPEWKTADQLRMTTYSFYEQPIEQSERWVNLHIPHSSTLLVDDDVWTDFVEDGFEQNRVIWTYKLDLDPAVHALYPGGWKDVDYVISTPSFRDDLFGDPSATVDPDQAVRHSNVIATFGSGGDMVQILKVRHP